MNMTYLVKKIFFAVVDYELCGALNSSYCSNNAVKLKNKKTMVCHTSCFLSTFFRKTTKLGYVNANSVKDLTSFQMSLSVETHTRASCQSLLGSSMTLCVCFLFCSPLQCCVSFGDFTQQELCVSHLHFLSYCVDRAGSVKEKHFEENTLEHLMEAFSSFRLFSCWFNVNDLYCINGPSMHFH